MAVLAVLATVSFRGLSSVLDAEAHVHADVQRWKDVAVLTAQLDRDLSLAVGRPVRDGTDRMRPAMIMRSWTGSPQGDDEGQLVITRLGDSDGASSRGELRRVGYRLRDGVLEYLVWPALDPAPGTAASATPVLDHVDDLQLRALDHQGAWIHVWPAGAEAGSLPRAVEVRIALVGGERITRVFPLR